MIGSLIGARLAYGSWPWQYWTTWTWTRAEIKYLRDVIENHHTFGVKQKHRAYRIEDGNTTFETDRP